MAIGKREQIVGISIAALGAIALIHLFIFAPRAEEYGRTLQEFTDGQNQLRDAEVITSPLQLENYRRKTEEYTAQLDILSSELNLTMPDYYTSLTVENLIQRVDDTTSLVRQLVQLRTTVRQPQLTFLDNRPHPQAPDYQLAWNLPRQLPNVGASGAIMDTLVAIANRHQLLQSIPDPVQRMQQRHIYNDLLRRIGLNPAEVSHYVVRLAAQQGTQPITVYFNDKEMVSKLTGAVPNEYSIARFGVAVPMIKKMWHKELLGQLTDQRSPLNKDRIGEVLEADFPLDETLLTVNRQLQSLIDIIRIAERNQVLEISQVVLLKPADFAKVEPRIPGQVPEATPEPTPDPVAKGGGGVMGARSSYFNRGGAQSNMPTPVPADQKVGTGSGIELTFRATNRNMVGFLFDIGTAPRTYSVDDLHIYASPDGILTTSGTIEIMSMLSTPAAGGAPAATDAPESSAAPELEI